MSNPGDALAVQPAPQSAPQSTPILRGAPFQMRFAAIWFAMIGLIVFCAIVAPRSLLPSTFLAIIPLAIWASGKFGGRMHRSPMIQRLMRSLAGYNLNAATGFLATLSEFANDEPIS